MLLLRCVAGACFLAALSMAQPALPELRVEAVDTGSILTVKNRAAQPLMGFLIELVDYPGSSFTLWQDDPADAVAPGAERRISLTNMLLGAAPDYVRIQAAVFADGSTAGVPAKVALMVERRRALLETARDLIRRIGAGTEKSALLAELRQLESARAVGNVAVVSARRGFIARAIESLERRTVEETVASLKRWESALAASNPLR